jgi:hypothetical protein
MHAAPQPQVALDVYRDESARDAQRAARQSIERAHLLSELTLLRTNLRSCRVSGEGAALPGQAANAAALLSC